MDHTNPCFEIPIGPLEEGIGFVKFDLSCLEPISSNFDFGAFLDQYAIKDITIKSKKEHRYITDDWEESKVFL